VKDNIGVRTRNTKRMEKEEEGYPEYPVSKVDKISAMIK
jgi:hypothetical protein